MLTDASAYAIVLNYQTIMGVCSFFDQYVFAFFLKCTLRPVCEVLSRRSNILYPTRHNSSRAWPMPHLTRSAQAYLSHSDQTDQQGQHIQKAMLKTNCF